MSKTASEIIAIRWPIQAADSSLSDFLTEAEAEVDASFSPYQQAAIAHLAAHFIEMKDRAAVAGSATAGAIAAEKEGQLSRRYAVSASVSLADDILNSTPMGQEFKRIRRITHPSVISRSQNWIKS